jgi:hypothetical protein
VLLSEGTAPFKEDYKTTINVVGPLFLRVIVLG